MSKKKTSNLEAIIIRITVTIVTLLCAVIGAAVIMQNCCKIVRVGTDLMILNDNAQFYNEQPIKTNEMTEAFIEGRSARNQYYQSEDTVTRVFSNLPTIPKFCVWLLAIFCTPAIPLAIILYMVREVLMISYFRKRRMKKQNKQIGKAVEHRKTQNTANQGKFEVRRA